MPHDREKDELTERLRDVESQILRMRSLPQIKKITDRENRINDLTDEIKGLENRGDREGATADLLDTLRSLSGRLGLQRRAYQRDKDDFVNNPLHRDYVDLLTERNRLEDAGAETPSPKGGNLAEAEAQMRRNQQARNEEKNRDIANKQAQLSAGSFIPSRGITKLNKKISK